MLEKIILFGGTFDPIHKGHIEVAICAAKKVGASKIIIIPARRSPHKHKQPVAHDTDRIAMLQLAIKGLEGVEISNVELNRGEPSYTIDTVRQLREKFGEFCEFYWLIGADMLPSLPLWHKIIELLDECNVCVMNRGGYEKPDFDGLRGKLKPELIENLRNNMIETPLIEMSSTEIRQGIIDGKDVSAFLQPEVWDYIKRRKIYLPVDFE
ncbi:MAG: nicotinate (nicotinamide) nucleotide adenylyltransferase [Planctomycetes bacterium GWF2_42_9]|nr:MAG: nicotinate (nicotinamide) nucleotide adenylyltransferase [Planctomycetes bacterium GWF2_42_9]HAL46117.1 nicotinate (nicotinamide) nucleotide adenylyltransferase [Phycisphaerales bacterium]